MHKALSLPLRQVLPPSPAASSQPKATLSLPLALTLPFELLLGQTVSCCLQTLLAPQVLSGCLPLQTPFLAPASLTKVSSLAALLPGYRWHSVLVLTVKLWLLVPLPQRAFAGLLQTLLPSPALLSLPKVPW
jgi:hypothetical protein